MNAHEDFLLHDLYYLDMMNEIYPFRYGKWNKKIKLTLLKNDSDFTHDYYFVGTPPDSRFSILKKILNSKKKT